MPFFGRGAPAPSVFYDCYHEVCESVKKAGEGRFTNETVVVSCPSGHDVKPPGHRALATCRDCGLRQAYHCPTCRIWINLDIASSPVLPFVAGPAAGKTVLHAAMAMELRRGASSEFGLKVDSVESHKEYYKNVVNPFEYAGIIPNRTTPGTHNSLVMKLGGGGWSSLVARFSDVAGEVWGGYFSAGAADNNVRAMALQQATLHRSKSVVFLVDPERDQAFEGEVRYDLTEDIEALLLAVGGMSGPRAVVERRFAAVGEWLASPDVSYPSRLPDEEQLGRALAQVGLRADASEAHAVLEDQWLARRSAANGSRDDLAAYFRYTEERALSHRMAVVIPKADALTKTFPRYEQELASILRQERLRAGDGWTEAARTAKGWKGALRRIVALGNELAPMDLRESLDEKMKGTKSVTDFAFFFASALGGPTEPMLVKTGLKRAPMKYSFEEGAVTGAADAPEPQTWAAEGKRIKDASQGHRPSPKNVLLPLLWLMGS